MSQNDDENWTHFNVRCEKELRARCEAHAKELGQSLSEWIRRAMLEKVERAETGFSDAELYDIVKKVVLDIKQEQEQKKII